MSWNSSRKNTNSGISARPNALLSRLPWTLGELPTHKMYRRRYTSRRMSILGVRLDFLSGWKAHLRAISTAQCYQEGVFRGVNLMTSLMRNLLNSDEGQDIAEYAVMLAVILVIVVGTIRLIGSNSNTVFSQAASSIQ